VALLLAEEGQSLSLSNMLLKPRALYLLLLATFVRARLYPLPIGDEDGQASSVLSHLIPTGAGLYLLARFYTLFYEDSTILAILGGLSFFVGAFLAFCEHDPRKVLHYFLINQAGYVFLSTASIEQPGGGRDDMIFASINLFLCFGIFCLERKKARGHSKAYIALMRFASAIGQKYRIQLKAFLEAIFRFPWSSAFSGMAIASVAGAPLTLGFIGLASFYRSLFVQGNWFLLAMVLLTEVFLLASLFRRLASLPDALPRFCAGSALLCIPILLLGIHPPLLAIIAHVQAEFATLAAILRSMSIAPWLALLLPLIGGYVFHKLSEAFIERFKRLARLLRLDWLYISLGRIALGLSNIVRAAGELIEGEGYLGWITIFIIIVFLIL
jgi:formate hydrogenlyase subunit 3/multisubunit Na+/H+ antiporter MnhD subunit